MKPQSLNLATTAPINNQENQAQIMEKQTSHNTNQFMLQQTVMNQPVTQIPHHKEESKSENENLSYAESMKNLSVIFLASSDYDSRTKLIVRRKGVWNDSNGKLKRFLGVNIKALKSEFFGEEAVDKGGLLREFLSSVFEDVQKHIMIGGNNGFTFLHDVRKLADGQFFRFSQLIAPSLLHSCPGSRCLIESVAKHMLEFQSFAVPSINTVPDFELQTKLTEMKQNKQNFIHDIIYHCCIS